MAQLVMTIDSDNEIEDKIKSKPNKKQDQDDEEILLGHSVFLQDFDQRSKQKKLKGHAGAGSSNLWNFADSMQIDP